MTRFALIRGVFMALALVFIAGCAATQPSGPHTAANFNQAGEYTIGPGDTLQIYVRNNPDLSVTIPVRPDGKISVPMVQDMTAAGKTPSKLADDLETALSKYVRNPNVTVMVTNFVGSYQDQVRVVGQAARPQAISYRKGMTVLDVMIQVGGLTQFAAGNRATIVRTVDGERKTFRVRLSDLLNNGDIKANVPMRPGDILIIPEAFF